MNGTGVASGPTLPAASVARAVTVCPPDTNGLGTVYDQLPAPSAAVFPDGAPSITTVTVLFTSAVPVIVGVDVASTSSGAGELIAGAAGACVSTVKFRPADNSTVKFRPADNGPTLPAPSVARAVATCAPSANACPTVNV